ncbi:gamma-glutamylcyclotransferase [Mesorhizobium sp. M1405]|uniref:gamma-glutamylcyclotransferase n=1 Tax=unclassified Mesorhizobium TaxID=325217 RepID=UPI0033366098
MAQSIALRSMPISNMALTAALVARVERKEPDPGPHYGNFDLSEETRERWLRLLLEGRTPDTPFWVFSYGSLRWKPAFDAFEERSAVTVGWRRSFRLQLTRWCGTPDRPGLMLALDRGGSCRGIA